MQTLELTSEEREVMLQVLKHEIEAINLEVFRTDTHDFKEILKHRRVVLEQIQEKLTAVPVE